MKTYFIRHGANWDVEDKFQQQLWKEHKIAICFKDIRSWDYRDYRGTVAQSAVRAFAELAEHGGYVCATFAKRGCLVGIVAKRTIPTPVHVRPREGHSKTRIVKVIPLRRVRVVPAHKANRLLIGQPQGTVVRWQVVGNRVQRFVESGEVRVSQLDDLLPYEQEVMCSEFLRTPAAKKAGLPQLAYLSAHVGRNRKAVDIEGVTPNGSSIFAQVTHHQIADRKTDAKVDELRMVGPKRKAHLIMFCCGKIPRPHDDVLYYPLENVFEVMSKVPAWRASIGMS